MSMQFVELWTGSDQNVESDKVALKRSRFVSQETPFCLTQHFFFYLQNGKVL